MERRKKFKTVALTGGSLLVSGLTPLNMTTLGEQQNDKPVGQRTSFLKTLH